MENTIEILDYIEDNEAEWFELARQIKASVCKGLEEIANYHFSNESSIPINLTENASTTLNSDLSLNLNPPRASNCYLLRAQSEFLRSLQLASKLAVVKIPLKRKLMKLNNS